VRPDIERETVWFGMISPADDKVAVAIELGQMARSTLDSAESRQLMVSPHQHTCQAEQAADFWADTGHSD
jgi:hypothetical protein